LGLHRLVTKDFSILAEAVMKDLKKNPVELEVMETHVISKDITEAIHSNILFYFILFFKINESMLI